MIYTETKIITLNSANATRNNGTYLSNILFPFQGILSDDENIVRTYVSVMDAQIPCSFYTIDTTNNTILIFTNTILYTAVIASGNYNANTLVIAINDWFVGQSINAYIYFNKINGKFTFYFQTISTVFLTNGTQKTTMDDVLGLTTNTSGLSPELQNPANLLGVKRITIKSDALHVSSFSSSGFSSGSILATIPVNQAGFNMISYENTSNMRMVLDTKILNGIDIELVDEKNQFINFNGIEWSLTLVLNIEREYEILVKPKLSDITKAKELLENKMQVDGEQNITPMTQNEIDLEILEGVNPPTKYLADGVSV